MTRRIMVAMVIGLAGLQPATPVRAAVGVSPTADNTWGTEIDANTGKAGRVLAVAVSGGLLYLGGDFAGLSPPDSKDMSAVVRAALPSLLEAGGKVVTVASTLGLRALPDASAYCASKFGVVGFTRALALEMAGRVGVTLLIPGGMRTAWEQWTTTSSAKPAVRRP